MVWPAANVNTTNADAGTDSPAAFRNDALDLINKFNQLRSHPSPFIQGLLDDIDAAAARATLGAVGTLGNEAIAGSKTFSNGVGIAGQAADETGWTLTGYLRGLLLPATRAIWWAKGAATRSIGIVRQSGSNLLRFVSSTADDGTAAAFDALTVDAGTGNVIAAGTVFGGSTASFGDTTFRGAPGSTRSGIVIYEKPNTGSTLSGDVWSVVSSDTLFIRENGGTNRGVQVNLANAPAAAFGALVYIVAESIGVNGWRKWSNGDLEQWGTTGAFAATTLVVTLPVVASAIHQVLVANAGPATNESAMWDSSSGSLSTITVRRINHGSGSGNGAVTWRAFCRS